MTARQPPIRYSFRMQRSYDPSAVEAKWQKAWADAGAFTADMKKAKKPYYGLVMFPYPSGDKLHVGHWYNFAPADSYFRFQRMHGYEVFTPMGFDAFGLPAENYAIKTGIHPDASTKKNVQTMIAQLNRMGCMYDWEKMVNTSTPEYYRWTQWLFLQMHKHGLAYKKKGMVNYCPKDQTVLANEQVKEGKCERCGTEVVQKPLEQWFWNIAKYAQRLLDGLPGLEWPEKTKKMQENWIGRSEGVNFRERVKGMDIEFEVYDSIPQTFLAQTFTVIAPEHPLVHTLVAGTEHEGPVMEFVEQIKRKKMADKFKIEEEAEGIFTGRYVDNPFGTGDLPIWVCSYVLADYGTGIVNCSAHDERDFAFAKKYKIPLKIALLPKDPDLAEKVEKHEVFYREPDGIIQTPDAARGMTWESSRDTVIRHIEEKGYGRREVHYRLRDWLVSRQRYWGAPIPIVYDPKGNPHPVPEKHLPWLLPTDVEFKPTGKSPLRYSKEFIERTEKIFGKGWRPEFDTMDTFVCSSFYELRYLMEGDQKHFVDPTLEKKWMPVSMYIGGPEHATMHLIYARFVMMALKDFGFVSHQEPFKRLVHQGLITNKGAKMSKSKGNVVSPDDFVTRHGSDVFRMFLMFMGPFTEGGDWNDLGIKGIDRFVQRVWGALGEKADAKTKDGKEVLTALHRTIKRVTESVSTFHFNTAISALMELLNLLEKQQKISNETAKTFTLLLAPLAPHLSEELWSTLGGKDFVIDQSWPEFESKYLVSDTVTVVVQVNGRLRGSITVPTDAPEADVLKAAKAEENVKKFLTGPVKKEVYVKGRLVNFVV
jgi:leucyl-tRNA synthetase